MTWDGDNAVGIDLYYDPIVDAHVGNGPIGLIAPAWYFAPQKKRIAEAAWRTVASFNGVFDDRPISGLEHPADATMFLQIAGEFADPATKQRIWETADHHVEPTWDAETGEFTLGFGLDETHPRGQWNARCMAGWVCEQGAWSRLFNQPNLAKFTEPTVEGVDFPSVALSEARWDGHALHLAAQPQNKSVAGTTTSVRITNVKSTDGWVMAQSDGKPIALSGEGDHVNVELKVDNRPVVIHQGRMT